MWTRFMDMHSGGDQKLAWDYIYIEAPKQEAISVFELLFGRNPNNVTCNCCGDDYSITEDETLEQATEYNRKPYHSEEISLSEYMKDPTVCFVTQDRQLQIGGPDAV